MSSEASLMQQMQADSNACNTCPYNGLCEEGCVLGEVEDEELEDWDILQDEE